MSQNTQLLLLALAVIYLASWFVVFVGSLQLSELQDQDLIKLYGPYLERFGLTPVLNTLIAIALLWELLVAIVKELRWAFTPVEETKEKEPS